MQTQTVQTGAQRRRETTPAGSLAAAFERVAAKAHVLTWPSKRYQKDPVAFAREVLGVEPWSRQVEILRALAEHDRVAVTSGHKTGKSTTFALAALWFFCSFPDARVIFTSSTSRQVDSILWRELKRILRGALVTINNREPAVRASSGLKAADLREIIGFTAREPEAAAGVSGRSILYLPDEASGIPDALFDALEGNTAGGDDGQGGATVAKICMASNPTRTDGYFYRAFHPRAAAANEWATFAISSEETPNAVSGRTVIPGLAQRAWCQKMERLHGRDSAFFKVRVLGQFPIGEEGKIFSLDLITEAQQRWDDTPATGPLTIGLDPAGAGTGGDESVIAVRRGQKITDLTARRGLDEEALLAWVLDTIHTHSPPGRREKARVVLDSEGEIGWHVLVRFRAHLEERPEDFELVRVRSSEKPKRSVHVYRLWRDELVANFLAWVRAGGAVPEDELLEQEMHHPRWEEPTDKDPRQHMTPKKVTRAELGRSPDRFDACVLCTWEPRVDDAADVAATPAAPTAAAAARRNRAADDDDFPEATFDPYSGGAAGRI